MAAPSPMNAPGVRDTVVAAAREHALDYYLSALLAPRACRDDLIVLAAFHGELQRIPLHVREPMAAEVRLQWWRDWIGAMTPETSSGNPLADALADVVLRHSLARQDLLASIDARSLLEPEATGEPILAYRQRQLAKDFAGMRRAAGVMGAYPAAAGQDALAVERYLECCGLAVTFAQMALILRRTLAQQPTDTQRRTELENLIASARLNLKLARTHVWGRTHLLRIAALPVAVVEPYLRACESVDAHTIGRGAPASMPILPLTRTWRLWLGARMGRI